MRPLLAALLLSVSLSLPAAAGHKMTWHGGRVLEAPRYTNLYWGPYWSANPGEVAFFDRFTSAVAPAPELASQIVEYSVNGLQIGAGAFDGSRVLDGGPTSGATVNDADIQARVQQAYFSGEAPQPDLHRVYVVYLAPGAKVAGLDNAVGYHQRAPAGFHYIVIHFDNYVLDPVSRVVSTVTASHEMAETMTDPDLDGWFEDGARNEIGDVCQGQLWIINGYSVQMEWSNELGECVAQRKLDTPGGDGNCPSSEHRAGPFCVGDEPWGCSSAGATPAALCALGLFALRRRKSARRPA